MLGVVLALATGVVLLITGALTIPILRDNTWCVLPVIVISGLGMGHVALLFVTPFTSSKKKRGDIATAVKNDPNHQNWHG
jgi:hypothetical protein